MDPHLLHLALALHRPHLLLGHPTWVPQLPCPPSRPRRQAVGARRAVDSQLGFAGHRDLYLVLLVVGSEEFQEDDGRGGLCGKFVVGREGGRAGRGGEEGWKGWK